MKEKRALVFGGGSDLGSATVNRLIESGWQVHWTYHESNKPQAGERTRIDLRVQQDLEEFFCKIEGGEKFDLVVTSSFPFLESPNSDFLGYVKAEAFLRSHVYIMTEGRRILSEQGRIINILGQCVERGLPGAAFYSASLSFLHNLGHSINGKEGKERGISVCDILLGPAETREWDGLSEEIVDRYRDRVKEFITPDQVAETIQFIAQSRVMPSTFKLDGYYGYGS